MLSVSQALANPGVNIVFRRALSPRDLVVWEALRTDLESCNLSEGQDSFQLNPCINVFSRDLLGPAQSLSGRPTFL
jgi:hypothetical protein